MSEEPLEEIFEEAEPVEVLDAADVMEDLPEKPKKKNKTLWIILIVVAALLLVCCCVTVIVAYFGLQPGGFLDDWFSLAPLLSLV
jgi:hypothetical protein